MLQFRSPPEEREVLLASGFDAGIMDPLARQMVTAHGFATIAGRILDVAEQP